MGLTCSQLPKSNDSYSLQREKIKKKVGLTWELRHCEDLKWEIHLNWKFSFINECIWIIGENVFLSCVLTQSTSTREHRESNNGWCCSWSRSGPRTFMLNDDHEAFSETLFFFENDESLLRENGCLAWPEEEELHSSKVRRSFRCRQGTVNHHLTSCLCCAGNWIRFKIWTWVS